jgi:hypothetical protein
VDPRAAAVGQRPVVPLTVAVDPVVAVQELLDVGPPRQGEQDREMQAVSIERRGHQALLQDAQHVERQAIEDGIDLKASNRLRHDPLPPSRTARPTAGSVAAAPATPPNLPASAGRDKGFAGRRTAGRVAPRRDP